MSQKKKPTADPLAWCCLRCGHEFSLERARAYKKANLIPRSQKGLLHVCGACKELHLEDGGKMRLLTPAEKLQLYVEMPRTMAAVEAFVCPPDGADTLVIPNG